jgi:hypothetical protein
MFNVGNMTIGVDIDVKGLNTLGPRLAKSIETIGKPILTTAAAGHTGALGLSNATTEKIEPLLKEFKRQLGVIRDLGTVAKTVYAKEIADKIELDRKLKEFDNRSLARKREEARSQQEEVRKREQYLRYTDSLRKQELQQNRTVARNLDAYYRQDKAIKDRGLKAWQAAETDRIGLINKLKRMEESARLSYMKMDVNAQRRITGFGDFIQKQGGGENSVMERNLTAMRLAAYANLQKGTKRGWEGTGERYKSEITSVLQQEQAYRRLLITQKQSREQINLQTSAMIRQKREVLGLTGGVRSLNSAWLRMRHMGIWQTLSSVRNTLLLVSFALASVVFQVKKAIDSSREYEKAFVGLNSLAIKTGQSTGDVRDAAMSLAKDGLMTVQEAAAGLKNLFASGMSLPEATALMLGFKDSASFARQGSLSYGEAIVSATEGIKNQNSILVDNAGLTKNLSIIMRDAGLTMEDFGRISEDVGVRSKFVKGLLDELSLFQGDASRLLNTYEGSASRVRAQYLAMSVTVGNTVQPALKAVNEIIIRIFQSVQKAFGETGVQTVSRMTIMLKGLFSVLETLVNLVLKFDIGLAKLSTTLNSDIGGGALLAGLAGIGWKGVTGPVKIVSRKAAEVVDMKNQARQGLRNFAGPMRIQDSFTGDWERTPEARKALEDYIEKKKEIMKMEKEVTKDMTSSQKAFFTNSQKLLQGNQALTASILGQNTGVKKLTQSFVQLGFRGRIALMSLWMGFKTLISSMLPMLLAFTAISYIAGIFIRQSEKQIEIEEERKRVLAEQKQTFIDNIQTRVQEINDKIQILKKEEDITATYEERLRYAKELRALDIAKMAGEKEGMLDFYPESLSHKKPSFLKRMFTYNQNVYRETEEQKRQREEYNKRLGSSGLVQSGEVGTEGFNTSYIMGGKSYNLVELNEVDELLADMKTKMDYLSENTPEFLNDYDMKIAVKNWEDLNNKFEHFTNLRKELTRDDASFTVEEYKKQIEDTEEYRRLKEKETRDETIIGLKGIAKEIQEIENERQAFIAKYMQEHKIPSSLALFQEETDKQRQAAEEMADDIFGPQKMRVQTSAVSDYIEQISQLREQIDLIDKGTSEQLRIKTLNAELKKLGVTDLSQLNQELQIMVNSLVEATVESDRITKLKDIRNQLNDVVNERGLLNLGASETNKFEDTTTRTLVRSFGYDSIEDMKAEGDEIYGTMIQLIHQTMLFHKATKTDEIYKDTVSLYDQLFGKTGTTELKEFNNNIKEGVALSIALENYMVKSNIALKEMNINTRQLKTSKQEQGPIGLFGSFGIEQSVLTQRKVVDGIIEEIQVTQRLVNVEQFLLDLKQMQGDYSAIDLSNITKLKDKMTALGISLEKQKEILSSLGALSDTTFKGWENAAETLLTSFDKVGDTLYTLWIDIPNQIKDAQAQVRQDLADNVITYAESQQRMMDIDRQATQARIANYVQFADAVVVQTMKMIAVEYQRYLIQKALKDGGLGVLLSAGSLIPILGVGFAIAGIGLASQAMTKNNQAGNIGNFSGGSNSGVSSNRSATAGIQAPIQNLTIIPTLTVSAGNNVYIGSGSIQEFNDAFGDMQVKLIKDALETGEITVPKSF